MTKQYLVLVSLIVLMGAGVVSCATEYEEIYRVKYFIDRNVTAVMLAQIGAMEFYTPKPGDAVSGIYIPRTTSPMRDIVDYEGGEWFRVHNRIVAIEACGERVYQRFVDGSGRTTINRVWYVEYVEVPTP